MGEGREDDEHSNYKVNMEPLFTISCNTRYPQVMMNQDDNKKEVVFHLIHRE